MLTETVTEATPSQDLQTPSNNNPNSTNGTISYDGREISSSEASEILQRMQKQLKDKEQFIGRQSTEVGSLRERLAKLEGMTESLAKPQNQQEEVYISEEEFLQDIPGSIKRIREDAYKKALEDSKKMIESEKESLIKNTQSQKAQAEWWDGFYSENKNLAPLRESVIPFLVNKINSTPGNEHISLEEGKRLLVEEANKYLLKLKKELMMEGAQEVNVKNNFTERASRTESQSVLPNDPISLQQLQVKATEAHKKLINRITPSYSAKIK